MSFLESIVLGIVQGVSEFLPVSSSGHLVVMRAVFGVEDIPLLYDVLLHVATLIVVVLFFRRKIADILASLLRFAGRKAEEADKHNIRLSVFIVIATCITAGLGLLIRNYDLHTFPKFVSGMFLVTAALLISTQYAKSRFGYEGIKTRHAVVLGFAQGLAVIPGISRAGSTIAASLHAGISREDAGEVSFLISIPAILGALLLELRHLGALTEMMPIPALAAGIAASMAAGFLSLALLVKIIKGGKLWVFSVYLIPLGIAGLIWL